MRLRVVLLPDFEEEQWPSMSQFAQHLESSLTGQGASVRVVRPRFRRRALRLTPGHFARNVDRLLNRFHDYPRYLHRHVARSDADVFHVVDHSYAQLAQGLPAERVVVTCHDLNTFTCLLEPSRDPRAAWFRRLVQRTLDGLCRAAYVVCDSEVTARGLLGYGLVPPDRLSVIHPGIGEEFFETTPEEVPREFGDAPTLVYVGSSVPRKRLDVLLETLAAVRWTWPEARLIKAGGPLTADQQSLARRLEVLDAIEFPPYLDRPALAALYRRADLVLFPSEAEGFGLPVAEALARGASVLASDLDVLREVGGEASTYAPVGDLSAWADAARRLLGETPEDRARRGARGRAWAARFTWDAHARKLLNVYSALLGTADTGRAASKNRKGLFGPDSGS